MRGLYILGLAMKCPKSGEKIIILNPPNSVRGICNYLRSRVDLDFPKIKKLKKFVMPFEHAQKCENNAVFKQNSAAKLLIAFK